MNRTLLLVAAAGALALAPLAFAGPRGGEGHGGRAANARHARKFVKALELTDAQKAQWKDARIAAEPVREDLRTQLRAMRQAFRAGERTPEAREAMRAKGKATALAARSAVAPSAARLLASLTPEQRAKIDERAKAHGKTIDDAKLLRRIEGLLLGRHRRGGDGGDGGEAAKAPTTPR